MRLIILTIKETESEILTRKITTPAVDVNIFNGRAARATLFEPSSAMDRWPGPQRAVEAYGFALGASANAGELNHRLYPRDLATAMLADAYAMTVPELRREPDEWKAELQRKLLQAELQTGTLVAN